MFVADGPSHLYKRDFSEAELVEDCGLAGAEG